MTRRLAVFLAVTFGVSWGAWGGLVLLTRARATAYGEWPFMALYLLGGLGPTIAAWAAVAATAERAPIAEFHRRLLRWRLPAWWYPLAIGLPVASSAAAVRLATLLRPALVDDLSVGPWSLFPQLLGLMVLGGGLEELGWRGVAQEELQRLVGPGGAALRIGVVWAAWHLPLFALPGVSQHDASLPVFAVNVLGSALVLGWLYRSTSSILLCVLLHAAGNASAALGLAVPRQGGALALLGPGLQVVLGGVLLLAGGSRFSRRAPPC